LLQIYHYFTFKTFRELPRGLGGCDLADFEPRQFIHVPKILDALKSVILYY